MKHALVLEPSDVKRLIAEKFNVSEENVIKSQYTYTVVIDEKEETDETKNV